MVAMVGRIWISLLVACSLGPALGGCGGSGPGEPSSEDPDAGLSEEQREESERAEAADRVPEADRLAYYQLATGSGLLRAWAQAVSSGQQPPAGADDAELRAAERRLAELDAEDPGLERLVARLIRALRRASGRDRSEAKRLVSESDAINAGLQRYVRRNPVISILLPD
jgi:hypothetical protein